MENTDEINKGEHVMAILGDQEKFVLVKKRYLTREAGVVSGSAFPEGTYLHFEGTPESKKLFFVYPDSATEELTHDMVKCATILTTGIFTYGNPSDPTKLEPINGSKYLVVLKDGRQFIHLVSLAETQYFVERIYF